MPTKLSCSGQISTLLPIICRSLFLPCPFRLLSTVLRPTIRWTLYSLAKYLIIAKCLLGKCLLLIILYQNRMWRNEVNMRKRERTREKVNFKHLMKLIDVSCLKGSCHLGVFLNIEIPMAHWLSADSVKKLWPGAWAETDAENVPAKDNGRARLVFTSLSFIIWWMSCTTLNSEPCKLKKRKSIFDNASHLLVDVLSQNWLLSFSNPLTVFCCRFEEFEDKIILFNLWPKIYHFEDLN